MKKLYTIFIFSISTFLAQAGVHQVTVNASSFSPATVNAVCGDTVGWILGSGSHTTTSTTIPSCATAWNAPINTTSPVYAIVVPCAGTYNYVCSPHGFTGVINVTCSNGIASINNSFSSSVFPNPFSSKITVEFSDAAEMISIYNMVGEKIKTIALSKGQTKLEINAADLKEGIYFYSILKEGIVIETRKLVKN